MTTYSEALLRDQYDKLFKENQSLREDLEVEKTLNKRQAARIKSLEKRLVEQISNHTVSIRY